MPPDKPEHSEPRHDAARAAQARADDARRRAREAREAAEQATTEYTRRAHHRVADLHSQIASSHDRAAWALRIHASHAERA
jgi:hypothetical protein